MKWLLLLAIAYMIYKNWDWIKYMVTEYLLDKTHSV
jgi:hypothetical protein